MRNYDLEERLINFADMVMELVEILPSPSKIASHLGGQILRSGTAPALLYGEAQAAESPADFIHKTRIILKELRETQVCNKLISRRKLVHPDFITRLLQENGELVAIFTASVKTASQKQKSPKPH